MPRELFPWLRDQLPETGVEFLDNSVFSIAPRTYYRYRDNSDGSISEALALGGAAGFESGWLYDFLRVGLTGYFSLRLYGPKDRDGTGLLQRNQESYAVLGEAYADFKFRQSFLTVGRSRLDMPYINANDSRMTPNTFEEIEVYSSDLEKLPWAFGHILRIRQRTESEFKYMSDQAGAGGTEKGVTFAAVRWNLTDRFHLAVIDQFGWDTFNTIFVETEWTAPLKGDFTLRLGSQFTDQRSVGDELLGRYNAQHVGVKGALGYRSLVGVVSFTWADTGGRIRKPWGGSPSYNSVMISDFDSPGTKSARLRFSYDLSELCLDGWSAATYFVYGNSSHLGTQKEYGLTIDYKPAGSILDNLWLRGRAAWNDNDENGTRADYRIILNYSYTF